MKEIIASTWNDFQDCAFYDSWDQNILRHRSSYVFRGLSVSTYDLLTGLQRTCKRKIYLEQSLIRNFRKYASLDINNPENHWEVISLGQHHGLPTRLLDWTFSPYVALHFATANLSKYNQDGVIWCLDFDKCKEFLPNKLKQTLKDSSAHVFTVDMLNKQVSGYEELSALQDDPFILLFEPPSIDSRIVNQYALFSVLSRPDICLTDWLKEYDDIYYKIIIPAEKKLEFRDKLDEINMSERNIYPGLDGLCQWLKRHYTPSEDIYPGLYSQYR